jgi:hypothetical protein
MRGETLLPAVWITAVISSGIIYGVRSRQYHSAFRRFHRIPETVSTAGQFAHRVKTALNALRDPQEDRDLERLRERVRLALAIHLFVIFAPMLGMIAAAVF